MSRIFITGDTHIPIDIKKLNSKHFEEGKDLTKDDFVIILGDFGLIWNWQITENTIESNIRDIRWTREELYWKKWLDEKPWTTLFIDGNHENMDRLNSYPIADWNGGKVHKISNSIIHLMRGEVFTIDNKTFFTFGGARSTDRGPATGTELLDHGICWWPEELCSQKERDNAVENLQKHNNKVDYILTHCLSDKQMMKMGFGDFNTTSNFLWGIEETVNFKQWFAGHYHVNEDIDFKIKILYNNIIELK